MSIERRRKGHSRAILAGNSDAAVARRKIHRPGRARKRWSRMGNPPKSKGDCSEPEIAPLSELLRFAVRRKPRRRPPSMTPATLDGIPDTVVQVANWNNGIRAVRREARRRETQRLNAGADYAATAVRPSVASWRFVPTPEQFATYVRNTIPDPTSPPN